MARTITTSVLCPECCGGGCCPYPADQLGVGYTQDDLPDTIDLDITFDTTPGTIITLSRSGDRYGPYTSASGVSTYILVDFYFSSTLEWYLFSTDGDPLFDQYTAINPCLFRPFTGELQRITDTFADTYTVEFLTGKQVTVTRESLCSWFGTANIDGFEYEASLTYNDETFEWEASFSTVDISSGLNSKDGNQNTPVGTYSGDNVITVSE